MINKAFKNATSAAIKICKQKKAELRKVVLLECDYTGSYGLFGIEYETLADCKYHYVEINVNANEKYYQVNEMSEKEL